MERVKFDAFVRKVMVTLKKGEAITVVGWKVSNHDEFTASIPRKCVTFYEDGKRVNLGQNTGLVIMTKFVSHSDQRRLNKGGLVHPAIIQNGMIKKALLLCRDLLVDLPSVAVKKIAEPVCVFAVSNKAPSPEPEMVSPSTTTCYEEVNIMNPVEQLGEFTVAFLATARENADGLVGKNTLSKLILAQGINQTSRQLVFKGYILPVISPGMKAVGKYKAGPKMLPSGSQDKPTEISVEPKNPIAKLQHLLGQEDATRIEIENLRNRLAAAEKLIERIEMAKKIMKEATEI